MLFSVIVPVYNVEKYLVECLESILPQVVDCADGAELILVDDGSTDDSGCICDQYQKAYPDFVRVFHKQNGGTLETRRFGFWKATGDYIINCDSDDLIEKTALKELADIIQRTKTDVIFYNIGLVKEDNQVEPFMENVFSTEQLSIIDKREVLNTFLFSQHNLASLCCKCFKRSCFDWTFPYETYGRLCFGEDPMQSVEILANAEHYVYYNRLLYYYRAGIGIMSRFNQALYKEYKMLMKHIAHYMQQCGQNVPQSYYMTGYFSSVGMAITQTRLEKSMSYQQRKAYLQEIREDQEFEEALPWFSQVSKNIKKSYCVLCMLLIAKQYRIIDLLLRVKNLT